jgi:N-acetylneuraminate synthase
MYTIAEIGQAHEGSLGIAHSYIDSLKGTGVNAVKFQIHIAEAESSMHEPFRIKFSIQDETRFSYWKRMEFSVEQWIGLKNHAHEAGFDFIVTPCSLAALDLSTKIGVDTLKIGSADVNNYLMLDLISETSNSVIISSGMSNYADLDIAIEKLTYKNNTKISILQCTTKYPTSYQDWGLNVITELKKRYSLPVGFSDHSGDIFACLSAASVGAEIFEFHVVFDKRIFGPDSSSSILIKDVSKLVDGLNQVSNAINHPIDKNNIADFVELNRIFGRSLAVNKDLLKGHIITISDLETKKPSGFGIPSNDYKSVIGKKIVNDIKKWDFLNSNNIE